MAWDADKSVNHLKKHAQGHSLGKCAEYTREAIEAGGVVLVRHNSAKDYGTSLVQAGFGEYPSYQVTSYEKGDVAIIQGIPGHPHGHMAMFDGTHWISDFTQRTLYPGTQYRIHKPPYKIYRHGTPTSESVDFIPGRSSVSDNAFLV